MASTTMTTTAAHDLEKLTRRVAIFALRALHKGNLTPAKLERMEAPVGAGIDPEHIRKGYRAAALAFSRQDIRLDLPSRADKAQRELGFGSGHPRRMKKVQARQCTLAALKARDAEEAQAREVEWLAQQVEDLTPFEMLEGMIPGVTGVAGAIKRAEAKAHEELPRRKKNAEIEKWMEDLP